MKCQNCGNELGQNEVFCGQCGAQNTVPAQPTEMMQAPALRSGLLSDGYRNRSGAYSPTSNQSFTPENRPQSMAQQGPQQGGGFYQDATEAVSIIPGTPANYPQGSYPQQGFSGGSLPGGYANSGQFGPQQQQPFSTGNYSNPTYPPMQTGFANGQFGQGSYGTGSGITPPQKRNSVVMVVGIVCLVFAIITVGIFGALFALRGGNNGQPTPTPVVQATATATPTPSPTATATPSPTAVSTPAPDANFSWCTTCTQSGYLIEFPNGWSQGATQDSQGTQFTDTSQTDIYAAVKNPSGAASANDLLTGDTGEFSSQNGYTQPQPAQSATIGGTNWSYQTFTYQPNGQTEQVNVYATIYQGKGYVIELQAQQAQFSTIYAQYFSPMLTRFQFVASGH